VDLWQINADENQDLLRELKVYSIPTLIVYHDGKETLRQVGAKPASTLQSMFETLAAGGVPILAGISTADRFVRLTAGLALASFGWVNGTNWILLILGGALMFSAVYDRCPIWRALTTQFKKLTSKA
jgi:hypothetical protein